MRRRGSSFPIIINLAVFIFMEVASLYMMKNNSELQRTWLANGSNAVKGSVWGVSESISDYFHLKKVNDYLALENYELQEEVFRLNEIVRSYNLDQAESSRISGYTMIPAEVIKMSRAKQHNYIILNRGYEDGIKEKSGIITRQGVIGIVDAVSAHHCYAMSFQNNDISISARIGQEGGNGILVWDGKSSRGALLKGIPLQYKYAPGDTIFTSGYSLVFPPDIPLGVAGDAKVVNGSTNEIEVELFQEFKAIRYVTVVHNNSFEEIEGFVE